MTVRALNFVKLLTGAGLMKATGVGRDTLRHYEDKGLIKPISRTAAGHRRYAPDSTELIAFIKQTQQAGFSLKEIQELLNLRATALNTCNNVSALLDRKRRMIDVEIATWRQKRAIIDTMIRDCCAVNDCQP